MGETEDWRDKWREWEANSQRFFLDGKWSIVKYRSVRVDASIFPEEIALIEEPRLEERRSIEPLRIWWRLIFLMPLIDWLWIEIRGESLRTKLALMQERNSLVATSTTIPETFCRFFFFTTIIDPRFVSFSSRFDARFPLLWEWGRVRITEDKRELHETMRIERERKNIRRLYFFEDILFCRRRCPLRWSRAIVDLISRGYCVSFLTMTQRMKVSASLFQASWNNSWTTLLFSSAKKRGRSLLRMNM